MSKILCALFVLSLCAFIWSFDRLFWLRRDNEELKGLLKEYAKERATYLFQRDSLIGKHYSVVSSEGYLSPADWEVFNKHKNIKVK